MPDGQSKKRRGFSYKSSCSLQIRHRTSTLQPTERTSKKVYLTLSLAAVQAGRPPSLDDLAKTPEWKAEDSYFDPRFPEKNYHLPRGGDRCIERPTFRPAAGPHVSDHCWKV